MQYKKESYLKKPSWVQVSILLLTCLICLSCVKQQNSGKIERKYTSNNHEIIENTGNNRLHRKNRTIAKVCQSEKPPTSLNPLNFDSKVHEITFHIFDRLVQWDENGNIISSLATHWKRIHSNTYEIKLRKNVFFHNGEPFNSSSVKFSIDKMLKSGVISSGNPLKTISQVQIKDEYTIIIKTTKPDFLFFRKLSLLPIIPEKYFTKVGELSFSKHPIGTGAYKFNKWKNNGSLLLTKNYNYWQTNKPYIDNIEFKFIESKSPSKKEQLQALFNGDLDLLTDIPGLYSLKIQKNPSTKVIKLVNGAKVFKMIFNTRKQPFNNLLIRKAANIAINRDVLIKVLAKGNGRKIATNSVSSEFGHNSKLTPYPYNPSLAREIIRKTGLKNLQINIAAADEAILIAEAVKKDFESIGIKSSITKLSGNEMVKTLIDSKKIIKPANQYDLFMYSGEDPLFHVGFFYSLALYSKGAYSTVNDHRFDQIYEKLMVTLDEKEQLKLCHKLEEISWRNYWYTPIFQVIETYGASKDLMLKDTATTFIDLTEARFSK